MTDTKFALITGAAKRIGAQHARSLHAHGYTVLLHYGTSHNEAKQLCLDLNNERKESAFICTADLNNPEKSSLTLLDFVKSHTKKLHVLINNASSFYPTPVGNCTQDQWDNLFNSNCRSAFFISQAMQPLLKSAKGCIINMIDIYAEKPLKSHPLYSMAKASIAAMTRSLALELAPEIRVNGISPGAILWPENQNNTHLDKDELSQQQQILDTIALQTTGTEHDIAKAALYLIENAPYVTGQIITVDGGRSLHF